MPDTDITSAARRVADDIREGNRPLPDDMLALLPVLDAVTAGRDDTGRVERWHAVLCGEIDVGRAVARAAIALADAEAAERAEGLSWEEWKALKKSFSEARSDLAFSAFDMYSSETAQTAFNSAEAALNAFVVRLIAMAP